MHSATLGSGSAEKNRLIGFGRGYVLRKWSVLRGPRALRALVKDGCDLRRPGVDRPQPRRPRGTGARASERSPAFAYPG